MKILTTMNYWDNLQIQTKAYWVSVATRNPNLIVCTGRPDLRGYKGATPIRRASGGGKWGKSTDIVKMDLDKILKTTAFILVSI